MFIHVGLRLYILYGETVTGRVLDTMARDSLLLWRPPLALPLQRAMDHLQHKAGHHVGFEFETTACFDLHTNADFVLSNVPSSRG